MAQTAPEAGRRRSPSALQGTRLMPWSGPDGKRESPQPTLTGVPGRPVQESAESLQRCPALRFPLVAGRGFFPIRRHFHA